MSTNHFALIE